MVPAEPNSDGRSRSLREFALSPSRRVRADKFHSCHSERMRGILPRFCRTSQVKIRTYSTSRPYHCNVFFGVGRSQDKPSRAEEISASEECPDATTFSKHSRA